MATAAVQKPVGAFPKPSYQPIIERSTQKQTTVVPDFDPTKHLAFKPPPSILMMKDIGYAEDTGVSPVAVSQPFQLFSPEAIQHMRTEVIKPEVMKQCGFQSNIAASQVRGYARK